MSVKIKCYNNYYFWADNKLDQFVIVCKFPGLNTGNSFYYYYLLIF